MYPYPNMRVICEEPGNQYGYYYAPEVHFVEFDDEYGNRNKHHIPTGYRHEYQVPEVRKKVQYDDQYGNQYKHHNPNGYLHEYQTPEVHQKVQFAEFDRTTEVNRNGKYEVIEEKVDVEADSFIQRKHNNFELAKMETRKFY
ncbi:hypothetical protein A4A49_21725 [Nicotiana attenuata]|uniref:Uncharacterized protein n=1 Tax=Nicotiana attenuata TaxID=49451 RepID=A0A1J6I6E6_NICAT|nr:hypothetical protein A4A49_21725 [Nicotiana attenuata]